MKGVFVTLEGGEGVGKTTQMGMLARRLEALGRQTVVTLEPGGTLLGERVRELLVQRTADPPTPLSELFLYAADRAHHVSTVIRPALKAGKVVLCDRYADATEAYQGWGRGLSLEVVHAVNDVATHGLWPHRTVVLDLAPGVGVERSLVRQKAGPGPKEGRFEAEALAFHDKVRAGYRAIAEAHPDRVRVVDATGEPREVFDKLWAAVKDLF